MILVSSGSIVSQGVVIGNESGGEVTSSTNTIVLGNRPNPIQINYNSYEIKEVALSILAGSTQTITLSTLKPRILDIQDSNGVDANLKHRVYKTGVTWYIDVYSSSGFTGELTYIIDKS